MSNFVPIEANTINDKDPSWINYKIKTLTKHKNDFFENSLKINNNALLRHFEQM